MKLKQLFLDLVSLEMGGTTCRYLADLGFAMNGTSIKLIFDIHRLNFALAE